MVVEVIVKKPPQGGLVDGIPEISRFTRPQGVTVNQNG